MIARAIKGDNSGVSSSAHGNFNLFLSNIGKPSLVILVVVAGLALGISICSPIFMASENRSLMEQMRRTERESRMTQYYLNIVNQSLNENHIKVPDYEEFKRQHQDKE